MYEKFMIEALAEARKAFLEDEVPIGAVLVCNDEIVARGHNTRNISSNVLGHAEIQVLESAGNLRGDWRIENSTLYVTLLPCPMCASAINQSRIKRVICGTVPVRTDYSLIYRILNDNCYGTPVELMTGVLEEECAELLKKFFSEKRQ